jgi:hypothetical protein
MDAGKTADWDGGYFGRERENARRTVALDTSSKRTGRATRELMSRIEMNERRDTERRLQRRVESAVTGSLRWSRLALLAVLLSPALGHADDGGEHARVATRAFDLQDWATALKEYKAAYSADPKPEYLWRLAQTQRLSGDCANAILSYQTYQRTASATQANAAADWIKTCEAELRAQQKPVEQATPGGAMQPPPVPAPAAALPQLPPAPAPRNSIWYRDSLGNTLMLFAVGSFVGGAVFLTEANSAANAATSGTDASWTSNRHTAKTESILGGVSIGVGTVLYAAALWRYFTVTTRGNEGAPPDPPSSAVGLRVEHDGLRLSYGGRF